MFISDGCPQKKKPKTNIFVLKIRFLIQGLCKCEGVGGDSGHEWSFRHSVRPEKFQVLEKMANS